VASHERFIRTKKLPFLLASDPDKVLAKAFGACSEVGLLGLKAAFTNRKTFVIDEEGKILSAIHKVSIRNHARDVLKLIE
jgi:peroxiredoxin Q/BCP